MKKKQQIPSSASLSDILGLPCLFSGIILSSPVRFYALSIANNTRTPSPYLATSIGLILLILLSLSWELWIAPLREGGSWLALKALPLCLPLAGILKERIYTYQYSSMLILIYFTEACMRPVDTAVASRICAAVSVLLCIAFFLDCLVLIKQQEHTSK